MLYCSAGFVAAKKGKHRHRDYSDNSDHHDHHKYKQRCGYCM